MKAYKIILILIAAVITANAQVTVKLQQPPPYQFKVEQFWKIVLVNNSRDNISVYLKGRAKEATQGKIIEATSSVIIVPPGIKTINGRELGPFTVSESNNTYKNTMLNTGGLPSGNYDICVSVFASMDGRQISEDCIAVTVENFNRMELISPYHGEVLGNIDEVDSNMPLKNLSVPPVIFSWLPPIPVPPGAKINYRLKLVEILGYQSLHSSMSGNPFYYQSPKTMATVLRYPSAAMKLKPGRKYAWAVEVFIDDFKIQESETRSFEIAGKSDDNDNSISMGNGLQEQISGLGNFISKLFPSGLSANSNKSFGNYSINSSIGSMGNDQSESFGSLKFYGDAKLTFITSSKPAQFSQLPTSYQTLELNPKLSLYEIPFGLNIFATSLKGSGNQSLNTVSFNLDVDKLKSKIKERITQKIQEAATSVDSSLGKLVSMEDLNDPNKLIENGEKLGLISGTEKLFLNIKTFGIGKTYPDYSELTVSGVPVNGLNLEINPGIFYLALAAWNNEAGIDDIAFKRSFLAARFGLGEKENSHFFFTGVKIKDDVNSIKVSSSNTSLMPQENVVIGTEGKITFLKKMLTVDAEAAVSGLTRNLNDADFVSSSIPDFITKLITPKLSSSFDYAWKGKIAFNHEPSATLLSIGVKRIGPGFYSLAAPNIRQDQSQFDFNFDRKFADKKITVKTFFKVYSDNLINWKQSTTTTTSYGINLGFNFPNLPFIQINYSPYSQRNDNVTAAQKIENGSDMFSLTSGYSYQFEGMYASTMVSFNGQWQSSKLGMTESKFSNVSYMLNQSINFEFPLTLSSTLSLSQSKILTISSSISEFDLNGNYQVNENITANLGGTISNEEHYTKRTMIYFGSNIIVTGWLRFELQGNISNYKDLSGSGTDYADSMIQASAMINW